MDVRIDQEGTFTPKGKPADVMDVLAQVNDFLRSKGRALQAIKADGKDIPPVEVDAAFRGKPIGSVKLLEITSERIAKLIDTCLSELEKYVPELTRVCHALAQEFQSETPEAGYEPFHQLAQIWQAIKEREILIAGALDLDLDRIQLEGQSLADMHEELNQYLNETADALSVGDCVLLGDLLEYELAPRAETEVKIVALLRSKSRGAHGGA